MKYKRTIVGRPYVREVLMTEGFTPGVSYTKNLVANRPVWCFTLAITFIATGISAYKVWQNKNVDYDDRLASKEVYIVRRREDVADPTRDCYN